MYKQAPGRHHRSKGIKLKHILQLCVLVAICFWLLYQVKHSHERSKKFESKNENSVAKLQSDSEVQRFGRKDMPRVTEIATNLEKHEEDEDDKEDEGDKENVHEQDEMERENDNAKISEREEETGDGDGDGDDEIDEHEPEKTEEEEVDVDTEKEDNESVNEENRTEFEEHEDTHEERHPEEEEDEKDGDTESEERDEIDKEDHGEREITSDDHDRNRDHYLDRDVERSTREAQEVLYRADDASSEVAQNVQSINHENENVTLGQASEIYGKINFGQDQESKTSEIAKELMKPDIQPRDDVNNTSSNATITKQKNSKVKLTKVDDNLLQDSTLPEIPNNSTVGSENLHASFPSNVTQNKLDSNLSQNGTIEIDQKEGGKDANSIENIETNNTSASSVATNDDEGQGKKPKDTRKDGRDEYLASHSSESIEDLLHDPIDASDTAIHTQEENESKTDSSTLPQTKSEVRDTEDAVFR